jgi:murein DD-endopeptidase MepM/ murein hydrolase activator NlpD
MAVSGVIKVLFYGALVLSPFAYVGAQRADYKCPLAGSPAIRGSDTVATTGGRFDSGRGSGHRHGALDLNSSEGTDVFAVHDGRAAVAASDWGVLGNTVIVDHEDGVYSVYAHLHDVSIAAGSRVKAGQKIGTVGYTGNAAALRSAGLPPHLHFALIRGDGAGLADADGPLQQLRNGADSWQALDSHGIDPVNPGSVMSSACWTGRTVGTTPGGVRSRD